MTLVVLLVILPVHAAIDGFVAMKLWLWFVASPFGLPQISLALGIGLGLVASHFTHQPQKGGKETDPWKIAEGLLETMILRPGLLILVGWIVKSWFFVGAIK